MSDLSKPQPSANEPDLLQKESQTNRLLALEARVSGFEAWIASGAGVSRVPLPDEVKRVDGLIQLVEQRILTLEKRLLATELGLESMMSRIESLESAVKG